MFSPLKCALVKLKSMRKVFKIKVGPSHERVTYNDSESETRETQKCREQETKGDECKRREREMKERENKKSEKFCFGKFIKEKKKMKRGSGSVNCSSAFRIPRFNKGINVVIWGVNERAGKKRNGERK